MGKTYRRLSSGYHRRPKGYKRAVINGARPKAIPPTNYDDIKILNESGVLYGVINQLVIKETPYRKITNTLRNKFKLKPFEIKKLMSPRWNWRITSDLHCLGKTNEEIISILQTSLNYTEKGARIEVPEDAFSGCTCHDCLVTRYKEAIGRLQKHWVVCDGFEPMDEIREEMGLPPADCRKCASFENLVQNAMLKIEDWSLFLDSSWVIEGDEIRKIY